MQHVACNSVASNMLPSVWGPLGEEKVLEEETETVLNKSQYEH